MELSQELKDLLDASNVNIDNLTDEELQVLLQVLQEIQETGGESETLDNLWNQDYVEIPVGIRQFIEDPQYLGESTQNGELVYDYWKDVLEKLFDPKNNYYECVTGDTKIPLLDGRVLTIREIKEEIDKGVKDLYVYSFDERTNEYIPGLVTGAVCNGVKPIYNVTLDNGESFKCTGNHRLLMRDKHYKRVDQLKVGDSMMPFNLRRGTDSRLEVEHPQKDGSYFLEYVHRMVTRWKYGIDSGYGDGDIRYISHHKDENIDNNHPSNISRISESLHSSYHMSKRAKNLWNTRYDELKEAVKNNSKEYMNTTEGKELARRNLRDFNERLKKGDPEAISIASTNGTYGNQVRYRHYILNMANYILSHHEVEDEDHMRSLWAFYKYSLEFPKQTPRYHKVKNYFNSYDELVKEALMYNHKIEKITRGGDPELVYDLEIERTHNYAIHSGVVSHNCILSGGSTSLLFK